MLQRGAASTRGVGNARRGENRCCPKRPVRYAREMTPPKQQEHDPPTPPGHIHLEQFPLAGSDKLCGQIDGAVGLISAPASLASNGRFCFVARCRCGAPPSCQLLPAEHGRKLAARAVPQTAVERGFLRCSQIRRRESRRRNRSRTNRTSGVTLGKLDGIDTCPRWRKGVPINYACAFHNLVQAGPTLH